jgi:hypothetical protein
MTWTTEPSLDKLPDILLGPRPGGCTVRAFVPFSHQGRFQCTVPIWVPDIDTGTAIVVYLEDGKPVTLLRDLVS